MKEGFIVGGIQIGGANRIHQDQIHLIESKFQYMFIIIKRGRLQNILVYDFFDDNKHIYIHLNIFVIVLFYFST